MVKDFEEYRFEMIELLSQKYTLNGEVQSDIPNLDFYFAQEPTQQINIMYEPSLCVILQGNKAVGFGNETLGYNTKEYLISSTHLPATMKIIEASKNKPYMSLRIKFSLEEIYELLKMFTPPKSTLNNNEQKGLFFGDMNIELYDSLYRIIQLLQKSKEDIEFLSPLLIKEILYHLVKSQGGYFLTKFSMEGTTSNKIVKAISEIKENYTQKLNVEELAKSIDMSESSLYHHFKTITTLSPIQFQKKLRLEEAKQLLLHRNMEVNVIAYEVGYESPSQFSREFSRMFGKSPKAFLNDPF